MNKILIFSAIFAAGLSGSLARAAYSEEEAKAMGLAEHGNAALVAKWIADHPNSLEGDFGVDLFRAAYNHLKSETADTTAPALVKTFMDAGIRPYPSLLSSMVRLNGSVPGGTKALTVAMQTESFSYGQDGLRPLLLVAIEAGDAEAFRAILSSGKADLGKKGSPEEANVLRSIEVRKSDGPSHQADLAIMKTIVDNRESLQNALAAQGAIDQLKTPYTGILTPGYGYTGANPYGGYYGYGGYNGANAYGGYNQPSPAVVVGITNTAQLPYGQQPAVVYPSNNDRALHILEQYRDANMFQATNTVTSGTAGTR